MKNPLNTLREVDREKGFTIVEVLVTVLIIGILAAIAIPMYLNQKVAALHGTMKADLRHNVTFVTASVDGDGNYPSTLPGPIVESDGVDITYASNGKSYCLKAYHQDAKEAYYYDSVLDGISENSCSLELDAEGNFYKATPGPGNIYTGSGTWTANGVGPSGETAMKFTRTIGAPAGWGAYGTYKTSHGVIPAGKTVKVSYYIRAEGSSTYAFQIINGPATSIVVNKTGLTATSNWQRVSHTIVTQIPWDPAIHSIRWGMGSYPVVEISDVQVDILS